MSDPRISADYESQFAELEERLAKPTDDEAMLTDVGVAIRELLSGPGDGEDRIRQILERQYDHGNLRKESYELVKKLLSKLAAESTALDPTGTIVEEPFTQTEVIDQPETQVEAVELSNELQIGTVLRDRYLLKESVAEGSMGIVYKALDRRLAEAGEAESYVAIKVLSPKLSRNASALRALQQEAAKGRCLAHPNIVRFIDLDREDALYFLVMEWLEGRSLSAILDKSRSDAIDLSMALDIVRQTADALEYAHQRGVIHADVKPGNIMITPEGQVKLIDFGVARIRQKENEGRSRFDPGIIRAATPAYSSMQVLTGEEPVPADDVFSLACLFYRLVAGYRVFGPRNAADAAEQGMEPQQPPGLPDRQWQALRKALSYSRVTRYQTPREFVQALGNAVARSKQKKEAEGTEPHAAIMPETVDVRPPTESLMHVDQESIMYEPDTDTRHRRSPWRIAVIVAIIIASVAVVFESGLIDTITGLSSQFDEESPPETAGATAGQPMDGIGELEPMQENEVVDATGELVEELVIDTESGVVETQPGTSSADSEAVVDDGATTASGSAPGAGEELAPVQEIVPIDFSGLPPPSLLIALPAAAGEMSLPENLSLREDDAPALIDLLRGGDLSRAMSVSFVEDSVPGASRPAATPQYTMDNDGVLVFEPGQPRARMTISMTPDSEREADSTVVLGIRNTESPDIAFGTINLTLEDDDRRRFEANLPADTVAFSVDRLTVREFDPAVQVDIARYRPGSAAVEVGYRLTDVTATEGQDYFAPGLPLIYFAPGQRTARILIPLGQDTRPERDEEFTIRLQNQDIPAGSGIFSELTVVILDDDS